MSSENEQNKPLEFDDIGVVSGVSAFDGNPYCLIEVTLEDGRVAKGQLSPNEVRRMALDWLGAADAATSDAAVLAWLTKDKDMSLENAAELLQDLRRHRTILERRDVPRD